MLTESDVLGQVLGRLGAGDYRERLHSVLGYRSPAEFEEKSNSCDATCISSAAKIEGQNLGFDAGILRGETRANACRWIPTSCQIKFTEDFSFRALTSLRGKAIKASAIGALPIPSSSW